MGHVRQSDWVIRLRTSLDKYLSERGYPPLRALGIDIEVPPLYTEYRGLVAITTNLQSDIYSEIRLERLDPPLNTAPTEGVKAELIPFLYAGERPPVLSSTLEDLILELREKKGSFILPEGYPMALRDYVSMAEASDRLLSRLNIVTCPVKDILAPKAPFGPITPESEDSAIEETSTRLDIQLPKSLSELVVAFYRNRHTAAAIENRMIEIIKEAPAEGSVQSTDLNLLKRLRDGLALDAPRLGRQLEKQLDEDSPWQEGS